jgi:hypothetical protein
VPFAKDVRGFLQRAPRALIARRVVGGFLKRGLAPSFLPLLPSHVVALLTRGAAEDVDVALAV